MREEHRAGEKLFIDYAGQTVPMVDPETGEVRQAQVFVAVLGAWSYSFAEATWTQRPEPVSGSDLVKPGMPISGTGLSWDSCPVDGARSSDAPDGTR